MADGFSVRLKGLPEIDARLVRLGAVAGEKIVRSTLFAASKPILDKTVAGLSLIPRGSGALAKATRRVYIRPSASPRTFGSLGTSSGSRFVVAVAPKAKDATAIALANLHYKRKRRIRGVFWGHLVEWGHRIGNRSTGRLSRAKLRHRLHVGLGRVSGLKIFTQAAESTAGEAIRLFTSTIAKRVERALKKAGQ